jgi:hypothetical protein
MLPSYQLKNDSVMAPVAQEAGIIELSLEELEGIQGGGFLFRIIIKVVRKIFGRNSNSNSTVPESTPPVGGGGGGGCFNETMQEV